MRIFISGLSDYFGATLANHLAAADDAPEITGTIDSTATRPAGITDAILRDNGGASEEAVAAGISKADVVVIDLHGPLSEAVATVKALRRAGGKGRSRSIVCVSSVQTWGRTAAGRRRGGAAPTILNEGNFTSRKPGPGYSHMKAVESQVMSLQSGSTRVTVVAAGILYGNGEGPLHSLFEAAWKCAPLGIPAYKGGAGNFIPTIHVQHLAHATAKIIAAPPAQSYIVAVDEGQTTLKEVMQAVGGTLNAGATGSFLTEEDSDRLLVEDAAMSALQIDLRFDVSDGGLASLDLGDGAICRGGIVENIDEVVAQYLEYRDLRPLRVVLLAPPASGAEAYAATLAQKYRLPKIDAASAVSDFLDTFAICSDTATAEDAAGGDADGESKDGDGTELNACQMLAKEIDESGSGSDLPISQLAQVLRWKLRTPPCQNQGYVLAGVPASFADAVATFCEEPRAAQAPEPDETGDRATMGDVAAAIVPTSVIVFDAPDEWLQLRAEGLEHDADESVGCTFADKLSAFRAAHDPENEQTPSSFFEVACKLETLTLSVNAHSEVEIAEMMCTYVENGGRPYNYYPAEDESGASTRELAERELRDKESQLSAVRNATAAAQARQEERAADDMRRLDDVERREAELLETRSLPLRNYLMAQRK